MDIQQPIKNPLLTVRDVMNILRVSRRTIYYWIHDGLLKPVKIGRGYRFHSQDIDQLLQSNSSNRAVPVRVPHILAVDDDLLVRESLKPLLSRAGYEVTVVGSADQAMEALNSESFHMILTDIRMPGTSGIQLLKTIRERRTAQNLPLLPEMVFTGFDDAEAMSEVKSMGIQEFMMKPFELPDFLAAIQRCVSSASVV